MSQKSIILLTCIVSLVSAAIFFLPSDEKKITKNLHALATNCSTDPKETVIESLRKATLASKLCHSPCRVEITSRNIDREFSQKEISDNILILKKRLPDTRFEFHDIAVEVLSKENALVVATIQMTGRSSEGRFTDAYEVDIEVVKIEGDWLFSSFRLVEFMVK